jgi:hypothetical protein
MTGRGHKARETASPVDLKQRQSDFFEEYFRKGAELTRALLVENEELRARLAELEKWARRTENSGALELARQFERIERDHNDLACLFVTQSQLDRVVEVREATTVITEVLLNFAGADRFAIFISDGTGEPKPLYVYGLDRQSVSAGALVTAAVRAGESTIGGAGRREGTEDPLVVFPLQTGAGSFGAVAIWSFLPQKQELAAIDERLFEVVGWSGGGALEAARLRGQPRSTDQPDRFKALSLLLGLG